MQSPYRRTPGHGSSPVNILFLPVHAPPTSTSSGGAATPRHCLQRRRPVQFFSSPLRKKQPRPCSPELSCVYAAIKTHGKEAAHGTDFKRRTVKASVRQRQKEWAHGKAAFAVRVSLCRASYGIFFFSFIIALNLILIFILLIYDKYYILRQCVYNHTFAV